MKDTVTGAGRSLVTCKDRLPGGGGNWIQTFGLQSWALGGLLLDPPGLFHGRIALSLFPEACGSE